MDTAPVRLIEAPEDRHAIERAAGECGMPLLFLAVPRFGPRG